MFTKRRKKALYEALQKIKNGTKKNLKTLEIDFGFWVNTMICFCVQSLWFWDSFLCYLHLGKTTSQACACRQDMATLCPSVVRTMVPVMTLKSQRPLTTFNAVFWLALLPLSAKRSNLSLLFCLIRKMLKIDKEECFCCLQGYVPLISLNALHQVHIFIFFLAVFHVIYSAITMMLGRAKVYIEYNVFIKTVTVGLESLWFLYM